MAYRTRHQPIRAGASHLRLLLLLVCGSFFFSTHALASSVPHTETQTVGNSLTVTPPISNEVLLNPGKGWVLYGTPTNQTPETLANASVGYMRYNWSALEPSEGNYNWSLIDQDLSAWHDQGKQFAFGVMSANSSNPNIQYVTPKWVFTDGAAKIHSHTFDTVLGLTGIQYLPVWNNRIFLQKVQDLVQAIAQRYDGNPDIAYIDIRSYGNWGGQTVVGLPGSKPIAAAEVQKYIQIYKNAFQQTQLIVPWGTSSNRNVYISAVHSGIGLRSDAIMAGSNGSELTTAYGKAPAVMEFKGGYQWLNANGDWNDNTLLKDVANGKPSYMGLGLWGNDASVMVSQKSQLVQTLANTMGYDFVLNRATIPTTVTNNQTNTISMTWKNQGVAYLMQPASIAVALLDASNQVIQKQWLTGIDPQTWTPGKTITINQKITFSGIPSGTYQIAVGLFLHSTDSNPTYQIGNQGRTSRGWYILSNHPSGWVSTGSLLLSRFNSLLTVLPNGMILVEGGSAPGTYTTDSELYNPKTGTWVQTGNLHEGRTEQTATLLPGGKVLVTGGYAGPVLNSAELYNPTTGIWSFTGSMNQVRTGHTATLLPSGQVLVAGGWNGNSVNTAELYNPVSGKWSMAANMLIAHNNQTATLLPNGMVLVTGGAPQNDAVTGESELYNPATNTWTRTGDMNIPRSYQTTVLLPNGKVLVAGGMIFTKVSPDKMVPTASAELYDPKSGTWALTENMNTPRGVTRDQRAQLLSNGKVLMTGGDTSATSEIYDPATSRWEAPLSMGQSHCEGGTAMLHDGRVLVTGGMDCVNRNNDTAITQLYTPQP